MEVLRTVLVQNYHICTDARGREVITRRETDTDGLPPGKLRINSPYDTDTRWAAKGKDLAWNGYKVHLSETCHTDDTDTTHTPEDAQAGQQRDTPAKPAPDELPNLITNVTTTDATVPDVAMTDPIHQMLDRRHLLPGEHYLDSGYPSADLITSSQADYGITLVTPLQGDKSPQAKAGAGFDHTSFTIDFDREQVICPQGHTSSSWSPSTQRGVDTITIKFPTATCRPCPVRDQCTTSTRQRRQLTIRPHAVQQALTTARDQQSSTSWQTKYALHAGVEGTIGQAVAVCDIRHARYRGLRKVHLQHVFSAVALNLIRLNAWWNAHPMDRTRTSHLSRLELALTA
ncbi:MAG: transposase [Pseudonocardiales bacterium]|nr:transposase [Pseudonocardiales bacterium]